MSMHRRLGATNTLLAMTSFTSPTSMKATFWVMSTGWQVDAQGPLTKS